ncbi:hypothetical protein WJ61_01100 [Burkholderia ubonensis]|uniref:hypothetical protein n=1 Tax=Burkholderia ubonensis TaxID=101571 RepID=UPI00075476C8|nr:hypothetical protein [Burkholderia ubonensis]KVM72586.1 hypothetical protein WJ61_01100 [Burkholderia ubonensis]
MNDQQQSRADALTERDTSKTNAEQGLYRKFDVRRVDGSDQPGGKHHDCEYFVLDLNHDGYARAALRAYARACAAEFPVLAADLIARYGPDPVEQPAAAPAVVTELASMTRMFHAACHDLGLINEALGLDPDDGGAAPILDAIAELKGRATSANETGVEGADEPYQVIVDVRDLFTFLRAAWREGQHHDREDVPDQANSWSAASDYANKTIERWTSMRPIVPRSPAMAEEAAAGLAHELWAAAQIHPRNGDGIEDAVRRITAILTRSPAMVAAAPADERAAFERYVILSTDQSIERDSRGEYVSQLTREWWRVWQARAAASPAAEAVAIPVEWDQDAAIEALSDFPKGSIWYEFLEEVGFDPTSGPIYVLTVQGRAMLDQLKSAYFAAPQPEQASPAAENVNDALIRKVATQHCEYDADSQSHNILRYGCEEDFFNCIREILAAPQPAQADAPAEAREPARHEWDATGERCVKCGDKDWFADPHCSESRIKGGAPADAGEPIGQHDLSTSTGGRAYIAEFFAKRLRRHDFGSYIAEWLAADFACALAQYLSEHDAASRAEPCVELPRFPTMLRKMWSGGEVQRWIDENIAPHVLLTPAAFSTAALATNSRSHDDR